MKYMHAQYMYLFKNNDYVIKQDELAVNCILKNLQFLHFTRSHMHNVYYNLLGLFMTNYRNISG